MEFRAIHRAVHLHEGFVTLVLAFQDAAWSLVVGTLLAAVRRRSAGLRAGVVPAR
jgi:hypothetical protein